MSIANFIRKQRIKYKFTQEELGKMVNVSNTSISNYENGVSVPELNTFLKLSDIFGVAYAPLISLTRGKADKLDFYSSLYTHISNLIEKVPECKIEIIETDYAWKYRSRFLKSCFLIIENNPDDLPDNTLVLAPVPEGKEHIYRICNFNGNTYLIPEGGPSYLMPLKIDKDSLPLKKILAVLQHL